MKEISMEWVVELDTNFINISNAREFIYISLYDYCQFQSFLKSFLMKQITTDNGQE